jgi:ABC-2 type transport system permease protein
MVAPNVPSPAPGVGEPSRYGEIFDRGYKRYHGPRLGRRGAFFSLVRYSIKRALGIKKSWTAKIIPIFLYVAAFIPVVAYIAISAIVQGEEVWNYPDFFGLIFVIEGIFVATIAPEMLCGDRRENVLSLYFSRAIKRFDYILAKLVAAAVLTLTISVVPAVILWLGHQFLEDSPLTAMKDNLDDLGRILLVGTSIAFYLGAIGLLVSSFTGRKSIAVAVILIGFALSNGFAFLFYAVLEESDNRRFFVFMSPIVLIGNFVESVFNVVSPPGSTDFPSSDFSAWGYFAGIAAIVLFSVLVMLWRYVPDE